MKKQLSDFWEAALPIFRLRIQLPVLLMFSAAVVLPFPLTAENRFSENLLANPSFETEKAADNPLWHGNAPERWAPYFFQKGNNLSLALDPETATSGKQSLRIAAEGQSRLVMHSTYSIDPGKTYRLSMDVKTDSVMGKGIYFRVQYSSDGKKFSIPKHFSGSIPAIGTQDWKEQAALLKDIPEGTTKVKVELFYDSSVGTAWIDSVRLSESYDFALTETAVKKNKGQTVRLKPVIPAGISAEPVTWTSSAPEYAVVDSGGTVTLLKTGAAVITARTADGNTASCKISIEDTSLRPQYAEVRRRWAARMSMNRSKNVQDADYLRVIEQLTAQANLRWEILLTGKNRSELWGKYGSSYISDHLTQTLIDLRFMARAFAAKDSPLYKNRKLKNDILQALQWFYENRYNERITPAAMYGNWWDWCIGVPQKLCDILILMYDYISTKDMDRYLAAIKHFNKEPALVLKGPNPLTGANLLDSAAVCALSAALEENNGRLLETRDAMRFIIPAVTRGDGFYADGSFIQHTVFPYTGSYGAVTLAGIENLLYISKNTPWQLQDSYINTVFEWVHTAFEPLMYKTAIMDMVSGRSIVRKNASDHSRGKAVLARILALGELTDDPVKRKRIRALVKQNILEDREYLIGAAEEARESYFTTMNPNDALAFKQLLKDTSIEPRGDLNMLHIFAGMDRVVFRRSGYVLGISMHSSRTGAFEIGNGENKRAWHTADGFISLYNDDQTQYTDDYWAVVDHHRLSGTTTDHSERTNKNWALNTGSEHWVGGAVLSGQYGAAGMEYSAEKKFSSLTAKKSWFFFDNEIVCLGAGITASDNRPVETIVEHRKLKNAGDTVFIADGEEVLPSFGTVQITPRWAFLGTNTENGTDTIGYYFPEKTAITASRELRSGNWYAVNDWLSDEEILKNFLSVSIPHGNNPAQAGYAYVLLPCLTREQTRRYGESPDIAILANAKAMQAVYEKETGIVGCNFWEAGMLPLTNSAFSATGIQSIHAEQPCSVVFRQQDGKITLAVSDPTQLQPEIVLTLTGAALRIVTTDAAIRTEKTGGGYTLRINAGKAFGKTYTILLQKEEVD
ncbi:MAG: polysaccharide lyase family 8 super-sandwich domain-containing protein [Treponema sp.]